LDHRFAHRGASASREHQRFVADRRHGRQPPCSVRPRFLCKPPISLRPTFGWPALSLPRAHFCAQRSHKCRPLVECLSRRECWGLVWVRRRRSRWPTPRSSRGATTAPGRRMRRRERFARSRSVGTSLRATRLESGRMVRSRTGEAAWPRVSRRGLSSMSRGVTSRHARCVRMERSRGGGRMKVGSRMFRAVRLLTWMVQATTSLHVAATAHGSSGV